MSQQGAVHRQHPWINRRAAMVATGLLAVMACNVRADNIRAEDLKAPADSTASPSSEPAVEAVSTGPEASVDPETEAEPAALAHRYARIPKRNAFGIKPPPAAPPPPEPEKEDNAVKVPGSGGAPGGAAPGAPGLPPSALRGNQPPPAIMNQPGNNAGAMNGAFFPGAVQGGQMPTVIGRGGAVLSGGGGFGTLQSTPFAANAIQAGGTAVHGGIEVPSISPSPDQLGGTVPANPSRPRNIQPPPFPGQ